MMKQTPYDILGVKKDSKPEDIKKAYRDKSKENHPDKNGKTDDMALINKAYGILSDPVKKEYYDATGNEEQMRFEQRLSVFVNQILENVLNRIDVNSSDVIAECNNQVQLAINNINMSIINVEAALRKLNSVKKRIKPGSNSVIVTVVDGHIFENKNTLAKLSDEIDFVKKAQVIIKEYGYDFDKVDRVSTYSWVDPMAHVNDFLNRSNK